MRNTLAAYSWAVYTTPAAGELPSRATVCEQWEWDALEREKPGHHVLVRGNITSEPEAEQVARGASGYVSPRAAVMMARLRRAGGLR